MATDVLGVPGLMADAKPTLGDSALSRTGNGLPTARGLAGMMGDPSAAPTLVRMSGAGSGPSATQGSGYGRALRRDVEP